MKFFIALIAFGLCAVAFASDDRASDKEFSKKQQDVWQLFKYINNPAYNEEYVKIGKTYSIEANAAKYTPESFENFVFLWKDGFLPRGEIFSVFNDDHLRQVEALFKLFYHTKDYQTFYETAVWARQHVNEGLFLYTFSVAIVHRPDTAGIVLPPIYDIYPYYFFDSEVFGEASYRLKRGDGFVSYSDLPKNQYKTNRDQDAQENQYNGDFRGSTKVYTVFSNYSGHLDPEQALSYFMEDVGINAYYYYFNVYFPFWLNGDEFHATSNRGEQFYYVHQQLLARFYLERLSHGLGGFKHFNWETSFETGFFPSLTYPNGVAFPERPNYANLHEYFFNYGQHSWPVDKYGYGFTFINTYEARILEAIDRGHINDIHGNKIDLYSPGGFNALANIIEGNTNSRYYGNYLSFARHLLGYAKKPSDGNNIVPSALEHFETSLRDPASYYMFKKIVLLFQKYKYNLRSYTAKDLIFPGVKIEQVDVEPLVTYHESVYFDITNGLQVTPEEYAIDPVRVRVHQYRRNHNNFTYLIRVNSEKPTKAIVKVFIGPKYDEFGSKIQIDENRMNFVELDHFSYDLKAGQTVIKRNSNDSTLYVRDPTSYFDYYSQMFEDQKDHEVTHVQEQRFGFPSRFMIPRGTEDGMTYQFYVIIYPFDPQHPMVEDQTHQTNYHSGLYHVDGRALGYPFDRHITYKSFLTLPNTYFHDVKVYIDEYKLKKINHPTQYDDMEQYQHQSRY